MKTLRLVLLVVGLLACNFAFSFSIFNLPEEPVYVNPVDNLNVHSDLINPNTDIAGDKTKIQQNDDGDTIIINLAEVIVESRFPSSARECISAQVPYPDFAQEQLIEGAVAVSFMFDEYGNVTILQAMSNDPRLENYVKEKVRTMHLKNCVVDVGKAYYMRFLFRLY
jgi:hypothetical protein